MTENKKQEVIDKLLDRTKFDVLKKLKQDFIEEDMKEPFQRRNYVYETLRIFDMLIDGFNTEEDDTESAIYDIVSDIFRHYGEQ